MNYITEINAFEYRMRRDPLPQAVQLLWYKLMHFSNRLHWPQWFSIDNDRLLSLMGISHEQTLRTARKELLDGGYIQFERGTKGHPSRYRIIPTAERDATAPPKEGADTTGPEMPEFPEEDFLGEIAEDIRQYFGFTTESQREVRQTAARIYEVYLPNEKPTQQDEAQVFHYTKEQTQDSEESWTITFPAARKELLGYAFEQARLANSINWNYIAGIYRNFAQRGITTVEQAEDYDIERDRRRGRQ